MRFLSVFPLAGVLALALVACEPEEEVEPTSPDYEKSLVRQGLRPMDEADTARFLNDVTIRFTYVASAEVWIEYFSPGGVIVKSEIPENPDRYNGGRPLLFGSWWSEDEETCFAYGASDNVYCYRLYDRDGTLLVVQAVSTVLTPAGALLAHSTEIADGNVEDFPLVAQ